MFLLGGGKHITFFSLPEKIIPDKLKQARIKQAFKALRKNETVGIHVKVSDYLKQNIHDGEFLKNIVWYHML